MVESIENFRLYHNWIKKQLYMLYLHRNDNLIEIGCGQGGDLWKILPRYPASVLNLDINQASLELGQKRLRENKSVENQKHIVKWCKADLTDPKTFSLLIEQKILYLPKTVQAFSSQFSQTYFWKSQSILEMLLKWISTFLQDGGYFFGTMPDGVKTAELCHKEGTFSPENRQLVYKSSICEIKIDPQQVDLKTAGFGHTCEFSLINSVMKETTIEYLIYWPVFVLFAEKHGLKLVYTEMFEDSYKMYHNSNLSIDEMKISFLNRSFVFQKI